MYSVAAHWDPGWEKRCEAAALDRSGQSWPLRERRCAKLQGLWPVEHSALYADAAEAWVPLMQNQACALHSRGWS